jgi:hypothetical protein
MHTSIHNSSTVDLAWIIGFHLRLSLPGAVANGALLARYVSTILTSAIGLAAIADAFRVSTPC